MVRGVIAIEATNLLITKDKAAFFVSLHKKGVVSSRYKIPKN